MRTQWIIRPLTLLFAFTIFVLISCSRDDVSIAIESPVPPLSNLASLEIIDTAYGSDPRQKMDVYLPARRNSATKLVVMIHGGVWSGGDKMDNDSFLVALRTRWPEAAFANINYREANGKDVTYDQLMDDVQSAINFLNSNKNAFNISDETALWGTSADAHLALQYAYTKNENGHVKCVADMFGPAVIADWDWYIKTVPVNVKDVITKMSGSVWNEELYKRLSPYHTATSTSPPTIIFHGNLDAVVPVYQSQWSFGKLRELGVPAEYHEYTDFHGFAFEVNDADCADKTIAFFKKHMK